MSADPAMPGAHPWRGIIEEYRDRLPVSRRDPGGHAAARAAPRSSGPARSREETGCEVWLKFDGANPTGSFKDRGMTLAISKALEEGAKAVVCASTGNTSARAAAYAAKGGPHLRRARAQGQGRARQDGADAGARRARARGRGQLRRVARARPGSRRALPGHAREQREPVPPAGAEDVRLRDRRRARPRARPPLRAGRQRRQHLEPLDRLLRVPGRRRDRRAAAAVRVPGAGRRADRARRAGEGPADDRDRDPDRQPGVVGPGGRGGHGVRGRRSGRSPTARSWPPTAASRARGCSSSRRAPRASPGCCSLHAEGQLAAGRPSCASSPATA